MFSIHQKTAVSMTSCVKVSARTYTTDKFFRPNNNVHLRKWAAPRIGTNKEALERRARKMEGTGLTKEQFARTRKPFDYPVITRHEVKRGNGAILKELNDEEIEKIKLIPRGIVPFKVGDRLAITSLLSLEEDKIQTVKGLVVAITKKNYFHGSFTIINFVSGVGFQMEIPFWSPFIRKITVMEVGTENFHKKKLWHLTKLPPTDVRVKPF